MIDMIEIEEEEQEMMIEIKINIESEGDQGVVQEIEREEGGMRVKREIVVDGAIKCKPMLCLNLIIFLL